MNTHYLELRNPLPLQEIIRQYQKACRRKAFTPYEISLALSDYDQDHIFILRTSDNRIVAYHNSLVLILINEMHETPRRAA